MRVRVYHEYGKTEFDAWDWSVVEGVLLVTYRDDDGDEVPQATFASDSWTWIEMVDRPASAETGDEHPRRARPSEETARRWGVQKEGP